MKHSVPYSSPNKITYWYLGGILFLGISALLGILLGTAGTLVAGKLLLDGTRLLPDAGIALGAVAFSVILGIIFGMYPAIKASGLQPVAALRAD